MPGTSFVKGIFFNYRNLRQLTLSAQSPYLYQVISPIDKATVLKKIHLIFYIFRYACLSKSALFYIVIPHSVTKKLLILCLIMYTTLSIPGSKHSSSFSLGTILNCLAVVWIHITVKKINLTQRPVQNSEDYCS